VDPLLIVAGLGIGVLVGVTGMGGGSLMTPILILFFGQAPITAIGSDITYSAVTKSVGGWRHLRLRHVNLPLAGWLALGSVPAAIAGVFTIKWLERTYGAELDKIVLTILAIVLVCVGIIVLVRALFIPRLVNGERDKFELDTWHKVAAVIIGVTTGFVIGLTSAGSGTLIAVFLIVMYRITPKQVVGTDIFHAAIMLVAAAIAHIFAGHVDFLLVGTILLGSVPGIWIGSHLTTKLPTGLLRNLLGIVLICSALALFNKAGVEIPLGAIIGVGGAFAAGVAVREFVRRARRPAPASPSLDAS
jgi:uncharacterized membrane protein YfcA